jgi:hypothetical protein
VRQSSGALQEDEISAKFPHELLCANGNMNCYKMNVPARTAHPAFAWLRRAGENEPSSLYFTAPRNEEDSKPASWRFGIDLRDPVLYNVLLRYRFGLQNNKHEILMNFSKFFRSLAGLNCAFLLLTLNAPASMPGDEHWDNQFGPVGANDTLQAIAVNGSNVFIGGNLTAAGNVKASRIASYDGTNWHALNNGMGAGAQVLALAADGTNVYAGGTFNNADGSGATNIARWDGTSWYPLGSGVAGFVFAIKIIGTNLYAGGWYPIAGGVTANNIARWDGSSWSALGTGVAGGIILPASVNAIESDGSNLYVGGSFTSAGGVNATNVARWNGNAWSALGLGLNGPVSALLFKGNKLYVGGAFTNTSLNLTNMAVWDGSTWSLWGGADRRVREIVSRGSDIYVGGEFTTVGGVSASRVARWDGNNWSPLGSGIQGFGISSTALNVSRMAFDAAGRLYAVGCFNIAGSVGASHVAGWDGTNWFALGGTTSKGVTHYDRSVRTFCYDGTNLYAGGLFTEAGNVMVNGIARWNGTNWAALGSGVIGNGAVMAIAKMGGVIYAGGTFTNMGGATVKYVAQWDGTNWSALGNGFNGSVYALAFHKGVLFAGGSFTARGDAGADFHGIAQWDGADWAGVPVISSWYGNNVFNALVSDGTNLYVGGNFYIGWGFGPPNPALGADVDNIGRWDGTNWWNLGTELGGTVSALALQNGYLYAGGVFTNSSTTFVKRIARWDGSSWTAVGGGFTNGSVLALAATPTALYAAGTFTNWGDTALNQIAKWDGATWSPLGSGLSMSPGTATGYALTTVSNNLYLGGLFIFAGDKPSMFIARWNDQLNFYPPPHPQLINTIVLTNRQCRFRQIGTSGESYIIQGSTNLSAWTPLLTNSATYFDYTDTNAPSFPSRFYRTVLGP